MSFATLYPPTNTTSPRAGQEGLARGDLVAVDLLDQALDRVEVCLRPQALDQADAQDLAVDVFREIEQVRLEHRLWRPPHRPDAEIGDAVDPGAVARTVDQRADGIN